MNRERKSAKTQQHWHSCIDFRAKANWDEAQPCWEKGCEQTDKTSKPEIYSWDIAATQMFWSTIRCLQLHGFLASDELSVSISRKKYGICMEVGMTWNDIPEKIIPPAPTTKSSFVFPTRILVKTGFALRTHGEKKPWQVKFHYAFPPCSSLISRVFPFQFYLLWCIAPKKKSQVVALAPKPKPNKLQELYNSAPLKLLQEDLYM